jgi:hypothetical protein
MQVAWLKCAIYSNTRLKDTSRLSGADLFDKKQAPYYLWRKNISSFSIWPWRQHVAVIACRTAEDALER